MSAGKQITILIVDDDAPLATGMGRNIERLGYKKMIARSGEEAIRLAAGNPDIDLILMDIDLGEGIDGREAARQILAGRDLPIVFMAPHPERRIVGKRLASPMYEYMNKNSGSDELQASIEMALELFASHEEKRENEELQRLILETVPIAIYTSPLDPAIDASWVSGDIEKVTGFTVGEYLAEKNFWRKRLHPDDRERVLNSYKDPAAGDEKINEYRWLCKDGKYKWFYDRAIKKLTPRGIQYIGIILDISERKQGEEALRESESKFKHVFEAANVGKSITMPTGEIHVNQAFCDWLGYTPEELSEKKWQDITPANDIEAIQQLLEPLLKGDRDSARFDKRYIHKNGTTVWADVSVAMRRDLAGKPLHFITTIVDISERKQAEEKLNASEVRYRRLFEAAKDGILILDATTGMITDVNPFLTEMLGYSAEEIHGKKIWELGSFKDIVASQVNFLELQQKGYIRYDDLPLESADGRKYPVEFVSNLYQVNHHQVIQCNIRDISDRKRAENIIRTRLRLVEFAADHSLADLLQKTLDEVCAFTDSPIGFYHFVAPDQVTLSLQAWSTRTLQEFCSAEGKGLHYHINEAGVWADCIRQRRPIIHNDYASLPHRWGLPEGHAQVTRELVVPILREQQIVAVLGIGNKEQNYTEKDIELVSYFADVAWEITRRKRAEETLEEDRKRLQKALDEVKTLRGIIPICANCKQIRDDQGYWSQVERYISAHTDVQFSHGICPECMKKLYPEFAAKKKKKRK